MFLASTTIAKSSIFIWASQISWMIHSTLLTFVWIFPKFNLLLYFNEFCYHSTRIYIFSKIYFIIDYSNLFCIYGFLDLLILFLGFFLIIFVSFCICCNASLNECKFSFLFNNCFIFISLLCIF